MLLVCMAATAVAACGPARAAHPAASAALPSGRSATSTGGAAPTLTDLVLDSWVTSGGGGFFVDGAWNPDDPAFSLYQTLWTAELDRYAKVPDGLDAAAVRRWAEPALRGALTGSGLPPIAQVSFATSLLALVGAPAGAEPVTGTLNSLRDGGMYRSAPTASPDWGSTAVAVQTLRSVGSPVPADVVASYQRALAAAPGSAPDAQAATNQWIPVLKGAVALRDRLDARELSVAAAMVAPALSATATLPPGAVRLADTADLRDIAGQLNVKIPDLRVDTWCGSLVDPSGRIAVPGLDPGEPQVTLTALRLGCPHLAPPTSGAPSRSGWPTGEAVAGALRASTAGYRIARAVGLASRFTAGLRWSALHAWRPDTADAFRTLELAQLRADLALPVAAPVPGTIGPDTRPDTLLAWSVTATLSTAAPRDTVAAAIARYAQHPAEPDIIRAALFEAAARLTGQPTWHQRALAEMAALRQPDGSYRVAAGRAGASLTALAIGAWIGNTALQADELTRLRLCQGWLCGDAPAGARSPASVSLADLAARLSCTVNGCGGNFPIVL